MTAPTALGTHLLIDLFTNSDLTDAALMKETIVAAVDVAGATLLEYRWHSFGDGAGITAIALLGESHMSVHTWPERQFAAFDLFTCNLDVNADNVIDIIKNAYPAKSLTVSRILRGENTRSTTL